MQRAVAFCFWLMFALPMAWADPVADCNQDQDRARCIKGCTQYIRQNRDPQGLAAAYHNRGVAYMHMGEVDQALADYDKVIEFSPNYGDAYYNRAIAHGAKGDIDKAITDYTKAIENNARDVDAFRLRGDAYRSKGDFARAVADYSSAIAFNPDDAVLYNSRALAHVGTGSYIDAIADATKATTLGLMAPAPPAVGKPTATEPAATKR